MELAALAKEDVGEDDGYLSTYMQGGAYILSKARHVSFLCLPYHEHLWQSQCNWHCDLPSALNGYSCC